MGKTTVKLEGMSEFVQKLNALPGYIQGNILVDSMRGAGDLIAQRMQEFVRQDGMPEYTPIQGKKRRAAKRLRDTIGYDIIKYKSKTFVGTLLAVRPQWPAGAHRHLVEYGHRVVHGGSIKKKGRSTAAKAVKPENVGKGRVNTLRPFTREFPFIRPAYKDTQAKATTMISSAIDAAVKQWLSDHGAK